MSDISDIEAEASDKRRIAELSGQLAAIKHRMLGSGKLPHGEFHELSRHRSEIVAECTMLQGKQAERMARRRRIAALENQDHKERRVEKDEATKRLLRLIRSMSALRSAYQQQAIDRTRTDAVRFMANQFQEQLGKIIAGDMP